LDTRPEFDPRRPRLRRIATHDLTTPQVLAIRALMAAAFGRDQEERFTDDDWDHAVGGVHFVLELDGEVIAHASVVEREIHVDQRPFRTGYVEAVATLPDRHGSGFGSLVMTDVTSYIRDGFELGVLGTGRHTFYQRLGWLTWTGPSFVRTASGDRRTPDDDGYILVLPTRSSPPLDLSAPISCDWRPGDVW
jgi:aminoglycoside 2'-N-acetyltransferase I